MRVAIASLVGALLLLAAAGFALMWAGEATGGQTHSPRFIAEHTNAILRQKCRPSYSSLSGTRSTWIHRHRLAHRARRRSCLSATNVALATWYGPGFYGNGTACGLTLTGGSMFVAHRWLACGTPLVICQGRTCVRSFVGDRGPYSAATFDLAPGLARALGCYCTQTVRWKVLR